MKTRGSLSPWTAFWFAPTPATGIALYRILFGLILLHCNALTAPDLLRWYGAKGAYSLEAWRESGVAGLNLFHFLPPSDGWLIAFFVVFCIATLTLTLGLFTRTSAFVVWLSLVSLYGRNRWVQSGSDLLLHVNAFWLMFSQAGAAVSLDRLRRVRQGQELAHRPRLIAPWGQRLIQFQSAFMYFSTSSWKILSGSSWWDGSAVYYSSRWLEFQRFPVPYLFDHSWTCRLISWGTLLAEVSLWTIIWLPSLRYYALAAGVLLHLGIGWSMNIPPFSALAMAVYVTFIPPKDLSRLWDRLKSLSMSRAFPERREALAHPDA